MALGKKNTRTSSKGTSSSGPLGTNGISLSRQRAIVSKAATANNVPFWVLWGIYGAESTWGTRGSNWFGIVAVPRTGSFEGDANLSGSIVKSLLKSHTLEDALRKYSNNAYGVAYIRQLGDSAHGGASTPQNPEGKPGIHIKNPVTDITSAFSAIGSFLATVLNPAEWGKLLANTLAVFLRFILKALYQYTVLPPWHWTERAVDYYWAHNMAATGPTDDSLVADRQWDRSLFTVAFWGLGYFLLWGKADSDEVALSGNKIPHTVLGRNVQQLVNLKGRKGLKKGKKEIDKATPPKPTPIASNAPVHLVKTVSANRRRTVTVTGTPKVNNESETARY